MSLFFSHYMNLERQLLVKNDGWPETSDFWKQVIEDSQDSYVRQVTARVGRRGGKSTTLCRILVTTALYGDWEIPAGDKGFITILSVNKLEAQRRLDTTEQILKSLGYTKARELTEESEGIEYTRSASELRIVVRRRTIVWQVVAATRSATVGGTSIAALCDEVSRWRDSDSGDNPAEEILQSLRPSLVSVKGSKLWLISSPWSTVDLHAQEFDHGNTATTRVYSAATWEANPTLTEKECRALEKDPVAFDREYKAIPMRSGENILLDAGLIDESVGRFSLASGASIHAGGDFGFVKNASSLAFARRGEGGKIEVVSSQIWLPSSTEPLKPSQVIRDMADEMARMGARVLCGDLYYSETVREYLSESQMSLHPVARPDVVWLTFRKLLLEDKLSFPQDDDLARQLKGITFNPIPTAFHSSPLSQIATMQNLEDFPDFFANATPTQTPAVRVTLPRQGSLHSDKAAAVACAVWSAFLGLGGGGGGGVATSPGNGVSLKEPDTTLSDFGRRETEI